MYLYITLGTTGLNPHRCAVNRIQCAVSSNPMGKPKSWMDTGLIRITWDALIEQEALDYQGVTKNAIKEGVQPDEAAKKWTEFMLDNTNPYSGNRPVIIGYKGDFDFKFLSLFHRRHSQDSKPFSFYVRPPAIDLCSIVMETLAGTEVLSSAKVSRKDMYSFFHIPDHPNDAVRLAYLHETLINERFAKWSR